LSNSSHALVKRAEFVIPGSSPVFSPKRTAQRASWRATSFASLPVRDNRTGCSHSAIMNRSIVISHPCRSRGRYQCRSPCPVGSPWAAVSAGAGMSRTRGCRQAKSRKPPTSMAAGDKTAPPTPTPDQRIHHAGAPRKYGLSVSSKRSTTLATVVPPAPDCMFSCSHPSPSRAIVQGFRKQSPISPVADKKGFDPAREVEGPG
jgi:hypothetical protein